MVFKLSPSGTLTVLHSFDFSDGANPTAGLIADRSGNLYGTTENGGGTGCGGSACGVVFKLAGTGFVTATPFRAFSGTLAIGKDSFALNSSLTLKSTASINPTTEPVTLSIGPFATTIPPGGQFTITIPPGSFKEPKKRVFRFAGTIDGVRLEVLIKETGTLRYDFRAQAEGANLAGTKNPVPVTLTIGDNSGTRSVHADIHH